MTLMRNIYGTATTLLSPAIIAALAINKRTRKNFSERLGSWPHISDNPYWFHGASRGELLGLLPIAKSLNAHAPFFSTMSVSGLDLEKELGMIPKILPLDIPWCVSRAIKNISPSAFIFGETELWPWLLGELKNKNIPIFLVNGRISDYTLSRYKTLGGLTKEALSTVTALLASSETAKERFVELGISPEKVYVTGNCKYDKQTTLPNTSQKDQLKNELFPAESNYKIVTLGSIRPGEEEFWFSVLKEYVQGNSPIRVIVAPRHKEQFAYFSRKLEGFNFVKWSELEQKKTAKRDVVLVDAFGVLEKMYSVSDLAFVGATLVNIGGHNPLEPAAYGVPVLVGPYCSNISDIVDELHQEGALFKVVSSEDIKNVLQKLIGSDSFPSLGQNAIKVAARHSGATKRVTEILKAHGIC